MKQLTMTKVLTPLAALAFAFGAQAAEKSYVGFETTETGYVVGGSVTNLTGWSYSPKDGSEDASVITAYGEAAKPAILPGSKTPGDNYLKLSTEDGTLFRNMDGASGASVNIPSAGALFVDTDVQFTLTEASERPTLDLAGGDKFVIWLESGENGTNLCVYGGAYSYDGSALTFTNRVYAITQYADGSGVSITPNAWYRLTVKASSNVGCGIASTSGNLPGFEIYLNGTQLKTGNLALVGPAGELTDEAYADAYALFTSGGKALFDSGTCFPALVQSLDSLSKVGFSGEGAVDAIVATTSIPDYDNAATALTFNWDTNVITELGIPALGETLTTSGTTVKAYAGQNFAVTLTGYNSSTHNLTASSTSPGMATVTVNGNALAVETVAAGATTINITTPAKNTVNVTLNWAALNASMGEHTDDYSAITYSINGGTPLELDVSVDESATIENVGVGTNITVAVVYVAEPSTEWITSFDKSANLEKAGSTFTVTARGDGSATITIDAKRPVARIGNTTYATFDAALADAATAGTATIQLASDVTVGDAPIAANKNITIDLNGQTITGAAEADAVFAVDADGTLTITNSANAAAYVLAGSATACIDVDGTLNIQGGKFGGAITGDGDLDVTVTGPLFTAAPANTGDKTYLPGYELGDTTVSDETYVYGPVLSSYAITYTLKTADGVAPSAGSYTIESGEVTLTQPAALAGYTFSGWYDNVDLTGSAITAFTPTAGSLGAKAFYGLFTKDAAPVYTITYNLNDGAWASAYSAPASFSADDADDVTLPVAANVERANYTFGGWYDNSGLSGDPVTTVDKDTVGNQEFWAKWTLNTYEVTFNKNNESATGSMSAQTFSHGVAQALSANTFALEGYTFAGWNTESDGTGTAYADEASYTATAAATLYAQWEEDTPSVPEITPGTSEETAAEYTEAQASTIADAINNAKATYIKAPTGAEAASYGTYFTARAVLNSDTSKVVVELNEAGTNALVTATANAVTSVAANLAAVAAAGASSTTEITIPAANVQPGFYYSVEAGAEIGSLTEGARVLATGSNLTLAVPNEGTKGFYRVKVSVTDK